MIFLSSFVNFYFCFLHSFLLVQELVASTIIFSVYFYLIIWIWPYRFYSSSSCFFINLSCFAWFPYKCLFEYIMNYKSSWNLEFSRAHIVFSSFKNFICRHRTFKADRLSSMVLQTLLNFSIHRHELLYFHSIVYNLSLYFRIIFSFLQHQYLLSVTSLVFRFSTTYHLVLSHILYLQYKWFTCHQT